MYLNIKNTWFTPKSKNLQLNSQILAKQLYFLYSTNFQLDFGAYVLEYTRQTMLMIYLFKFVANFDILRAM